jgi:transposase InsO family protein
MKDTKLRAFKPVDIAREEDRIWQLDKSLLDVPGRPWAMTITDAATRVIVTSHVAKDLTPSAVSDFVAEACREFGVPDCLIVDGGKEFISTEFSELTSSLNIPLKVSSVRLRSPRTTI